MKHTIIIACDHEEGEKFVEWLNNAGHDASIGRSTGNYVDGAWTSSDAEANEISNSLWTEYCNQTAKRQVTVRRIGTMLMEFQVTMDDVKTCFNCAEADISSSGDIWIAKPQRGHWLCEHELVNLIKYVEAR